MHTCAQLPQLSMHISWYICAVKERVIVIIFSRGWNLSHCIYTCRVCALASILDILSYHQLLLFILTKNYFP